MRYVLTPEEMGRADKATIEAGTPAEVLMERAGHAVIRAVLSLAGGRYGRRVVVVCGKGNNGGDGFVVARLLKREGFAVRALTLFDPAEAQGASAHHLGLARAERVRILPFDPNLVDDADVIVDAIFGTGFHGKAEGDAARAIEGINLSSARVVAVDIPSGVDGATGAIDGEAVRADVTVTMQFEKLGTLLAPGAIHAGSVEVADIGIRALYVERAVMVPESTDVASWLAARSPDSHKRSSGAVAVLAGSDEMRGAALLTVRGAQRMGAGYVTLGTTESVKAALAESIPEALAQVVSDGEVLEASSLDRFSDVIERADAIAIGPGLGRGADQHALVERLLREVPKRLVLDADALNALADDPSALIERGEKHDREGWDQAVITPHPAELARLLGTSTDDVQRDRLAAARVATERFGCVVLLKGYRTVVDSDEWTSVNTTGGPELASAGTGDVLTGALAAVLAGSNEVAAAACARTAAYVHGLAGAIASFGRGTAGVVAWDVAEALADARARVEAERLERRARFKNGDTVEYAGAPTPDDDTPRIGERGTVVDLGPHDDDICVSWEWAATLCHGFGDDLRIVTRR